MTAVTTTIYDQMSVSIYDSSEALGAAAANDLAQILRTTIAEQDHAAVILATGNSQLTFMQALRVEKDIAWNKVSIFHMDEYLDMSEQHPASFRRYIRDQLTDLVHPKAFFGIEGDAENVNAELARYVALLEEHKPIACVLGIGENGHLAFNDPPADLHTDQIIQVVTLDRQCREQQAGEGHFATVDDVPRQAITLTVPALLQPSHVLAVVPEARKGPPVKAALEGPVTPNCPASVLRTRERVKLYLDRDSASMLSRVDDI